VRKLQRSERTNKDVVNGFLGALPSLAMAEPVMAANPARLYGFPGAD
jgi:hypothetical protein